MPYLFQRINTTLNTSIDCYRPLIREKSKIKSIFLHIDIQTRQTELLTVIAPVEICPQRIFNEKKWVTAIPK
jgi:hypothetical protein